MRVVIRSSVHHIDTTLQANGPNGVECNPAAA